MIAAVFLLHAESPAATRARLIPAAAARDPFATASASPGPAPPHTVCLWDRGGDDAIYHFFMLNLPGLRAHVRPRGGVRVYMPWLHERGHGPHAYQLEALALLEPYFVLHESANLPEGCTLEFGGALVNDRDDQLDARSVVFMRTFFRRVLRERGILPARDPKLMLYVTRAGSERRAVLNEDAFLSALTAMGVRVVQLEQLNVTEKFRLFAAASLVISPQSAALLFATVAPRSAHVIEIFPEMDAMKHYVFQCTDLGISVERFTQLQVVGPTVPIGTAPFNFIVDAASLTALVEKRVGEVRARAALAEPPEVEAVVSLEAWWAAGGEGWPPEAS